MLPILNPPPYHPSGSSQCTSPKHPVSCSEPGLATRFIHDIFMFQCHSPKSSHPLPLPQRKMVTITLCTRQQKRHWCIEQSQGPVLWKGIFPMNWRRGDRFSMIHVHYIYCVLYLYYYYIRSTSDHQIRSQRLGTPLSAISPGHGYQVTEASSLFVCHYLEPSNKRIIPPNRNILKETVSNLCVFLWMGDVFYYY